MQREQPRLPTCSYITAVTSKLGRTENDLHPKDCFRDGGSRLVRPQASFLIRCRGASVAPKRVKGRKLQQPDRQLEDQMSVTAQTQPQFITIIPLYRSNNNKKEIIYQNVSIHVELVSVGSCRNHV